MSTTISHGIRVTAKSRYEAAHSDPKAGRYLFSYTITITNEGDDTVQLLRRHWTIRDSLGPVREVEGSGVVGETPVLAPGAAFTYNSACDLRSGLGRMDGAYLMETRPEGRTLRISIPPILLRYPYLAN